MENERIEILENCQCGNGDPSKFWIIKNPKNENELWGLGCKDRNCRKEYLIERFADAGTKCVMIANGVLLFENKTTAVELDPEFQVRLSRTRVRRLRDVKPGDHVGFDRRYIIWHHAIVVEVTDTYLVIEGWDGMIKTQRVRKKVTFEELTHLRKFNYSDEIERKNPPALVIARSNSRMHGEGENAGLPRPWVLEKYEEHYGFFNANCEHYATYCKTGVSMCNQTSWLVGKLKDAFSNFVQKSLKSGLAYMTVEALENIAQEVTGAVGAYHAFYEMIGLLGVIFIESVSFSRALKKLKEHLHTHQIDQELYREELGKRLIELLLVIVVAGGGGIIISACFSPLVEILLSPILMIGAKLGARFITRFMCEDTLKWYARKWELLEDTLHNIKQTIIDMKDAVVATTQKAVNFVSTEVLPRISAVIDAIRDFFTWLLC